MSAGCFAGWRTAIGQDVLMGSGSTPPRVLLVDEDVDARQSLERGLRLSGFEVATAASSAEAKIRLQADSYHLVITDLNMEKETSGFDVARFAKARQYRPAVAILTAYPYLGNEWKAKGADSLFIKPVNMPELLGRIEALLARQQTTMRRDKKASLAKGAQLPEATAT